MEVSIQMRGTSLVLRPPVGAGLARALRQAKDRMVWVEVPHPHHSGKVRLPVVKGWVRSWSTSDGRVFLKPQGVLATLWREILGRQPSARSLVAESSGILRDVRRLKIEGTRGPGGSLPLGFWPDGRVFRPSPGTPGRKYVRASGARPLLVAEVGMTEEAIRRLAAACGIGHLDPIQAARVLRANAEDGRVLLVLRRNPLTDPVTGFVVALPTLILHPGAGEMIWLAPEVPISLFGDEDGDRYFVDLAYVGEIDENLVSDEAIELPHPGHRLVQPEWLVEPETRVKHSGLFGVFAFAGLIAASGVGPLHSLTYRLAAALSAAGYRNEALSVSSAILRVLETLFDARKRVVGGGSALLLPYTSHLVALLGEEGLKEIVDGLGQLVHDLKGDTDPDAQENGKILGEGVDVLRSVLERCPGFRVSLRGAVPRPDANSCKISDLEILAGEELVAPLEGRFGSSERASFNMGEFPRSGRAAPVYEQPVIARRGVPARAYWAMIAQAAWAEGQVGCNLPNGGFGDVMFADFLLNREVVLPSNERAREATLKAPLPLVISGGGADEYSSRTGLDARVLLEEYKYGGRVFCPLYFKDAGEIVRPVDVRWVDDGDWLHLVVSTRDGAQVMKTWKDRTFLVGLGTKEYNGQKWHRWHLLVVMADKRRGLSVNGVPYVKADYRMVSLLVSPWIQGDPESISGAEVTDALGGGRRRFLPPRVDIVLGAAEEPGRFTARVRALSPSAQFLAAIYWGIIQLVRESCPHELDHWRPQLGLRRQTARDDYIPSAGLADRIIRTVRKLVRKVESSGIYIPHDLALRTSERILLFGDSLKPGFGSGVAGVDSDSNLWAFAQRVDRVAKALFGADAMWYPRKGNQSRLIIFNPAFKQDWDDLGATGISEWYRFVRETPLLKAVPSRLPEAEWAVVQEGWMAILDGWPFVTKEGEAVEAAFVRLDALETERSQQVELDRSVGDAEDPDTVFRPVLEDLLRHGFGYLRGVDGGLVEISRVLEGPVTLSRLSELGVAYKEREVSRSYDYVEGTVQFWAVSRQMPTGAKVVVLDGMIKSFATNCPYRLAAKLGEEIVDLSAVFSGESLRKKQAWGVLLAGEARARGIDPELIFGEYRRVLAERNPATPAERAEAETAATKAAFAKARELGLNFQPSPIYVDLGKGLEEIGHAWVGRVRFVVVDDSTVRDDDIDESGINATTLMQAHLRGVPYSPKAIGGLGDARRLVRAFLGVLGEISQRWGDDSFPVSISQDFLPSEVLTIEDLARLGQDPDGPDDDPDHHDDPDHPDDDDGPDDDPGNDLGGPAPDGGSPGSSSGSPSDRNQRGILYTAGVADGFPGPAGIGVVLCNETGEPVKQISEPIGIASNDAAEWRALLRGLEEARALGFTELFVRSGGLYDLYDPQEDGLGARLCFDRTVPEEGVVLYRLLRLLAEMRQARSLRIQHFCHLDEDWVRYLVALALARRAVVWGAPYEASPAPPAQLQLELETSSSTVGGGGIRFLQGDILQAEVDALVNPVNTVGAAGAGLALQFKRQFPENYAFYRKACKRGEVQPGKMLIFPTERIQPRYIINFPTKRHWREKSRMEDIQAGLSDLVEHIRHLEIRSVALPALGCGLGGLDWGDVKPLMVSTLQPIAEEGVEVLIYEPLSPSSSTDGGGALAPAVIGVQKGVLYADGASLVNPGPAGIGAVLYNEAGEPVKQISEPIGTASNNVAEYRALISGLKMAHYLGFTRLDVRMDSLLVVKQVLGEWRIKGETLILLCQQVRALIDIFARAGGYVRIEHIPREQNGLADSLSKAAARASFEQSKRSR